MFKKIGKKVFQLKTNLKEKNTLNSSCKSSKISKLLIESKMHRYNYGMRDLIMGIYEDYDRFNLDPNSRIDFE